MTVILSIDVSKQNLDVFDNQGKKHQIFPNKKEGLDLCCSLLEKIG